METDELRVRRAVRRLADLTPSIDVTRRAAESISNDRPAHRWVRTLVPIGAAAAVAATVIVANALSVDSQRASGNTNPLTSSPTAQTQSPAVDQPYATPSIGTVPGENEDQAGQIRAAKVLETDPGFGGVILGDRLITAYLTSDHQQAVVERAREELGPGDQLRVVVVKRTLRDLHQIDQRFRRSYNELTRAGVRVGTSGIDVAPNQFFVETPDVAKAKEVLAENDLGSDLVNVRYVKNVGTILF